MNEPLNREQPLFAPPRGVGAVLFLIITVLVIAMAVGALAFLLYVPPRDFPVDRPFVIEAGADTKDVVSYLASHGYVHSAFALYLSLVLFFDPRDIKASTYSFAAPLGAVALAQRLMEGDYKSDLVRLVHFEGETAAALAARAEKLLEGFSAAEFISITRNEEGWLFPDTYFVPRSFSAAELVSMLRANYEEKVGPLRKYIETHTLSEYEILILASILEREANTRESKRMVSWILQERLRIGMPLQADASLEYVLDKPLSELTPADLEIDSPYNTYLYKGLPPTPIGNPGLNAIMAVLEPMPSDYLFYITGKDGTFHYARNYDEHRRNIDRYLRSDTNAR
jgi:UPF0755 protein